MLNVAHQFDNPPNGNPLVPAASAIDGTAGGALYYNAFSYSDHATTAATLKVPSGNYCAGSGVTAQLEEGQRGWRTLDARYRKRPLVHRPFVFGTKQISIPNFVLLLIPSWLAPQHDPLLR